MAGGFSRRGSTLFDPKNTSRGSSSTATKLGGETLSVAGEDGNGIAITSCGITRTIPDINLIELKKKIRAAVIQHS